jgi:hypothetical protein
VTDLVDEDVIVACVDLLARSGAKSTEIGWLNDPGDDAYAKHGPQWYAHAQYKGARITTENHADPTAACEALATKVLTGAKCRCGKLVALGAFGAFAYTEGHMADGTTWTALEAEKAGLCRWRRRGKHWRRDCE